MSGQQPSSTRCNVVTIESSGFPCNSSTSAQMTAVRTKSSRAKSSASGPIPSSSEVRVLAPGIRREQLSGDHRNMRSRRQAKCGGRSRTGNGNRASARNEGSRAQSDQGKRPTPAQIQSLGVFKNRGQCLEGLVGRFETDASYGVRSFANLAKAGGCLSGNPFDCRT